ncbi:hypothetical protein [Heyndrickxia acidicola]|jgi:hypothetical protein|uniref:Uncharacterized protein n=1 Tax=Heyndrickxia acidicola TaxID=209389 RepID=A0ABU6MIB0_9BACI|nr:hypothetical protein [Heyndrickxia acidicola]MED1202800.1 hypothetical protein [Heyndrickxia acidicola]
MTAEKAQAAILEEKEIKSIAISPGYLSKLFPEKRLCIKACN